MYMDLKALSGTGQSEALEKIFHSISKNTLVISHTLTVGMWCGGGYSFSGSITYIIRVHHVSRNSLMRNTLHYYHHHTPIFPMSLYLHVSFLELEQPDYRKSVPESSSVQDSSPPSPVPDDG